MVLLDIKSRASGTVLSACADARFLIEATKSAMSADHVFSRTVGQPSGTTLRLHVQKTAAVATSSLLQHHVQELQRSHGTSDALYGRIVKLAEDALSRSGGAQSQRHGSVPWPTPWNFTDRDLASICYSRALCYAVLQQNDLMGAELASAAQMSSAQSHPTERQTVENVYSAISQIHHEDIL